jgi:methylenetetrahydrofolate dehydrogenase (NADP+)/methenyltetrahydrofolate cyclohydrolase
MLLIDKLNKDEGVTGIMVQLPLPNYLDKDMIINGIDVLKDVDGLTDKKISNLFSNRDCLCSCTPYGVMELLDRYNISVSAKNVVIVGRSNLVGKPLSLLMLNKDASVTVCHSKTNNLSEYTKMADILVVAVGKPNIITGDMVKEDSVIIDVGINRLSDRLCGDVDFDSVKDRVKYITPVPGGVGPMTVAMLGKNILKSYKLQKKC